LKAILRAVDKFCYRHPRFGIRNLMLYIIISNAVVAIVSLFDQSNTFVNYLVFNADKILRGEIWRLVTFLFVPPMGLDGNMFSIILVAVALYFYYFLGTSLQNLWGVGKFTIYYFSGALFMIIFGFIAYFFNVIVPFGAYYLNLGMFFVFATFYPNMQVLFMFFIPLKVKYLAWLNLAFFAYDMIAERAFFPGNLLPAVILLHYLLFCGGWLIDSIRPGRVKTAYNTVNFRQAAKQVQREQEKRPYTRRCEICGKTDTDYPNLEFRYCSRCQGYHCFCEEHINNHTHFS